MTNDDLQLGMGSAITRRDFLNGVAVGVGAAAAGSLSLDFATLLAQGRAGAYPPALTGLRGSHAGSFEVFHAMKDGAFWKTAPQPQVTGEEYDLVVVGAGISGLAAAHYFRKARPGARILLLDNHDDFGGPDLVPAGGGFVAGGYQFGPNQGLTVTGAMPEQVYTVDLVFAFDSYATTSWQKILDFKGLTTDEGYYTYGDISQFVVVAGSQFADGPPGLVGVEGVAHRERPDRHHRR